MCIFVRVSLFPSFNIIKELLGSTGSRFFIGGEVRFFDVDPAFWTRIPLFGPGSHPDPTPDPTLERHILSHRITFQSAGADTEISNYIETDIEKLELRMLTRCTI